MKKVLVVLFALMMMLSLVGCGADKKAEKAAPVEKVLRVGTDANFPPYEYYLGDGKGFTGFDVDMMKDLAKEMGYTKVEFVATSFDKIFKGLDEKKYDVAAAAITITDERKKLAELSDPYTKDGFKVVVKKSSTSKGDASVLAGKKVAVEKGSMTEELAKKAKSNVVTTKGIEEALKAVAEDTADYAIVDKLAGGFFITNGYGNKVKFADDTILTKSELALAVRKGDTEMLQKVNAALANYRKTTRFEQLQKEYFGTNK